ncbi:MAG: outer membrane beta-barrel family protein [Candidatus Pseudobacter hemicellulosilyticus]|uniref:Outer membrane beta-barrel family protein n=1 Tax=Candidatus Pseudobacter hemicellulosilyticus TaxID=3121375 RepID=A0AAJ5WPL1_9BACT|nr:MAG: outer membrane beta-barrel family protein [Pseudobacter sp.]
MRRSLFSLVCILLTTTLLAQMPAGAGGRRPGGAPPSIGRFYGRIIDTKTNKGLEAASVQLIGQAFDSVNRKRKDTVLAGMLTRGNGDFSLENLPIFGQFRLAVTAIGYKAFEQKISFDLKMGPGMDMSQAMAGVDKDLGNIKMEQDAELLESVTVSGSKPMIQMGVDRKIFNVEKNINSAGGTAIDVMRNVPAINVDIDGNVTLRNAAPQLFVDGRPTTLSLDQIPADAIASVELITNPSAKYDASGGQSGILNIVLKKNRKAGYSGSVRAGIDSRARLNGGGDINIRQGKLNFFASGMYNARKSIGWGETDRTSTEKDITLRTLQDNDNISRGGFGFGRMGVDYFVDNRNTISLSGSLADGTFKNDNQNNLLYQNLVSSAPATSEYRNTLGKFNFRNYGLQLGYKHLFAKTGKEFTADVNYNTSTNSNNSNIRYRSFTDPVQQQPAGQESLQGIDGGGGNDFFTVQADFINPITDKMKYEAGLRAQVRTFESRQLNSIDGVLIPAMSNEFEYTDYVYAGYVTFSQKVKENFSYQLGLRAESSSYDGEQLGKDHYSNEFPISLFPSVFLTRNFDNRQDLQVNYSRRINRPNFFQLMPNTDFSDRLNYQTGNPDLKPEFTHSLELSYQKTYGEKNHTFLATVFGKYTTDLIARYQYWQELATSGDSAFISTYINASSAYAAGLELVFRNNWTKWWEMNLNTNVYYSKINGDNVVQNLENERTSSFTKLNNTFKINKGWSIQLSGEYQSRSALPVSTSNSGGSGGRGGPGGGFFGGNPSTTQGYIDANYGADLGLRKDFTIKKNAASISVNWSDIFRTRRNFVHSLAAGFVQDEWRRRDPQVVRLNFSYRFGKFDAALFKRKNTRGEMEGMQNGMQGMQQ